MLCPRFPAMLALTALVATTTRVVSAAAMNVTIHGWYNCSQYSLEQQFPKNGHGFVVPKAECAIFKAPLCHDGVCKDTANREIDIFVKRYVTGKTDGKPNIIFMQGGPGAASPAMESAMEGLNELIGEQVNVYTLDHRGTGRSTRFDCVAVQALTSGSPGGRSVLPKEIADCAEELENKYGSDLSSFSVTSAASDLKYFITNFLDNGSKTFVYGVSYGTLLVERLMHLDPPNVAGYILDGIATTSGAAEQDGLYMSMWDINMNAVGEYYLSFCAQNKEFCGQYFKGTTVADALRKLETDLLDESFKCTDFVDTQLAKTFGYKPGQYSPSGTLRQLLGQLLQSYALRDVIPVLTYRLSRCNSEDKKVVNSFFGKLGERLRAPSEEDDFTSNLLYGLIVYSELWESPPPTDREATMRFAKALMGSGVSSTSYCAFTKDSTATACKSSLYGMYRASPMSYKKDKYWNVAAQPPADVSVLLLSGKMDPQTPHKYSTVLLEALKTTNKELVAFDFASHGTLWNTPMNTMSKATCGLKILASYVAKGGKLAEMDKSCIANTAKLTFQLPPVVLSSWLNATSAYDGKYIGAQVKLVDSNGTVLEDDESSPFKGVFIAALVLFIVVLVVAIVFFVKWRRVEKNKTDMAKDLPVYEEASA